MHRNLVYTRNHDRETAPAHGSALAPSRPAAGRHAFRAIGGCSLSLPGAAFLVPQNLRQRRPRGPDPAGAAAGRGTARLQPPRAPLHRPRRVLRRVLEKLSEALELRARRIGGASALLPTTGAPALPGVADMVSAFREEIRVERVLRRQGAEQGADNTYDKGIRELGTDMLDVVA